MQPTWLEDVLNSYNANPQAQKLLEQLALAPDAKGRFALVQGIIRFRDIIWLGGSTSLQQRIISAFHDSPMGGHSGFPVTYKRVHQLFAWPKMKVHIKQYVQCCQTCQRAKPERVNYSGLLEPLPVPKESWEFISMDFIDGLPQSGNSNCILVIVDKFTKFAHFLPLAHPYIAAKVALLYMTHIYKLHGFPGAIISDRDPVFTSHFWKELFNYAGSELRMSSTNHPQTNGQTERVNQCLETFLLCFTQACPKRWSYWLPLAQFWYNAAPHSSIGMSPFKAMYGREPRHWGITPTSAVSVPSLQTWLDERSVVQQVLQQHLHRAQQYMKDQADKKRTHRVFAVGDQVFLKLQPYVQTSVATRACHKLAFRFFGPYKIICRINAIAYELQLPAHSQVHPIFHVSQLRRAFLPGTQASTELPIHTDIPVVPVAVLQRRWRNRRGHRIEQVLVRWSNRAAVNDTWEDQAELQARFPRKPNPLTSGP